MANNCLQTKLKSAVDNNSLQVLGTITLKVTSSGGNSTHLYITPNQGETITISTVDGSAKLKRSAGDTAVSSLTNSYNTSIYAQDCIFEAGEYYIKIDNKYKIHDIVFIGGVAVTDSTCLGFTPITTIEVVNGLTKLDLTNLKKFSGACDISILRNAPVLESLSMNGMTGDIGVLRTITSLTQSIMNAYDSYLTGDITALNSVSNLKSIDFRITDGSTHTTDVLTGDLSQLTIAIKNMQFNNGKPTNFTWTGQRASTLPAIALGDGTNLGNYVDAMLKNQANCDLTQVEASQNYISANGTHDSSDAEVNAAIATIKAAGWVIKINGINM